MYSCYGTIYIFNIASEIPHSDVFHNGQIIASYKYTVMCLTNPLLVGICIFIFIIINSVINIFVHASLSTFQIISLGEFLFLDMELLG